MTTARETVEVGAIERRYVPIEAGAELRADEPAEGGGLPTIHGVACPWGSLSVELWRDWETGKPIFEKFEAGAFAKVLEAAPDVVILRDHDRLHLLGRTGSGTARVFESGKGLEYEVKPPNNEDGRTLVELVQRRDLFGSSFAFVPSKIEYEEKPKQIIRTVREVSLLDDCSPVTRAAYPKSAVAARSVEAMAEELAVWRRAKRGQLTELDADYLRLLEL